MNYAPPQPPQVVYYYPYPPVQAAPTNTPALLGMIFGILSLVTFGLLAVPGLILSIIGCSKATELRGAGKGMALAGLICSGLALLFMVLVFGVFLA